ncbi:hypothetical protein [Pseudoxanthomonas sp. PXM02]|uniref:hypothetical protein n=1 Tax=Pseudoxanthomonas sp. PXM02 TaxID=2769294 RepID=UPI0017842ADA|nr:hypothetical protein [Pseudoxanthomonas sp. PXM02]MBD9477981.1 hypothetical protein [Pseudoxanthomonas sp. PXM02]
MNLLLLVSGVAALAVLGWRIHRQYLRRHRIWTLGYRYALPPDEHYEFEFHASFADEQEARRCIDRVSVPGLASRLELSPNGQRWAVFWRLSMPARRAEFDTVLAAVHRGIADAGSAETVIVCSAGLRGSGTAFVLHAK